ncbi:MAG: NUDIX domain-containing protein [Alphaproteobacteria bacterium]|nr:NUDIX domain-containing protein [Alphaproteobacteria bacterium]
MSTRALPNETVELVEHVIAYQGRFRVSRYQLRHGLYQGGQSAILKREVFERGTAAAVLPYDPQRDEVVLIRQFRAGSFAAGRHPWTWEIVAGIIDDGETPEVVVRREAIEEAALDIGEVIPLHDLIVSPGACSEGCMIFLGCADTSRAGGIFGLEAEGENILVKVVPFIEARTMLEHGEIDNAITVIALQWLMLHRDAVRARWS